MYMNLKYIYQSTTFVFLLNQTQIATVAGLGQTTIKTLKIPKVRNVPVQKRFTLNL